MRRTVWIALVACLGIAQQDIPPGEARLESAVYWPRSQPVLRAESNLVDVGVVVRDERGRAVGGLTKNDFAIEDSGKKSEIATFRAESAGRAVAEAGAASGQSAVSTGGERGKAAPRYAGLFFDDFHMAPAEIAQSKIAAKRFVKEALGRGEQVAVFSMSKPLVQQFTSDAIELNAAIDRLAFSQRTSAGADTCPTFTPYEAFLVANNDLRELDVKVEEYEGCSSQVATRGVRKPPTTGRHVSPSSGDGQAVAQIAHSIWEEIRYTSLETLSAVNGFVDYMAKMPGTRVLVIASPGFLTGMLDKEMDEVADRALRREVVINSLDARGLYTDEAFDISRPLPKGTNFRTMIRTQDNAPKGAAAADNVLYFLAASTGGLFFHDNNDLSLGFRELGLAPEHSYSIGFTPGGAPDNKYHKITVSLKSHEGRTVQSRPGYWYAAHTSTQKPERRIDREILTDTSLHEMPGAFTASPARTEEGEPALRLVLHLDLHKMRYRMQKGIRYQKVIWIVALFDSGSYVGGRESSVEFQLKDATYRGLTNGFEVELMLPAPKGQHRLRSVMQEELDGQVAASEEMVEVR